jgi:23S rRNA pseudouridine1911/1915/1917 synthase
MPGSPRTLTADRGDAGTRLDLVLRRHLTDVVIATRTRVQQWIEDGRVTVNGVVVRKVASRAARGDVVTIALPAQAPRRIMAAEDVDLTILYEDEHMLALDKPPGIVVHPGYRNSTHTVMNALLWRARGWPAYQRPSIVGRLDKLTSGVVVVAKTAAIHATLQRAMASNRATKSYLAVVYGHVKTARGRIELRLARDLRDRRRVVASAVTGARSVTEFERVSRVAGLALLRCRLVTGRTHQIRVHLAARGWPIVGDATYGEPRWTAIADPALNAALRTFPRQALHAWRVQLCHPVTGEQLSIQAPVPPDLEALLTAAGLSMPAQWFGVSPDGRDSGLIA